MIEVGLEFSVDKRKLSSYGWDTVVAFSAAVLPAFFCFVYFFVFLRDDWQPSLLSGLSTSPTSAGVLFSMLMAAGLSATWVFKKARTLAVLDDLVTILLLAPLQIIIHGFQWESVVVLLFIGFFLFASFRWQNAVPWPVGVIPLLIYAVCLATGLFIIKQTAYIHLEVLIPGFMLGCLIRLPGHHQQGDTASKLAWLDTMTKGLFIFLVGASLPKVSLGSIPLGVTAGHVLILTLLSNIGKCFPIFCYRKEVPLKERLALSVAMFPRGEVGAAVLLMGVSYGFGGYITTLALLSLALNLVLTGIFIWAVIKLLGVKNK